MDDKAGRLELRVGIVALLAVAVLIAGALWGRGVTETFDQQVIDLHFDDAGGVTTSTPVYLNGVEVGSVSAIDVSREGVDIRAHIDAGIELTDRARAVVRIRELTGGKKIELIPGDGSTRLAGETIPGTNEGDIGELIAVAVKLSDQLEPTLHRIDSLMDNLTQLVGDPELQRGIKSTVREFSEVGGRANRLLASTGPDLQRTLERLDRLTADVHSIVEVNGPVLNRIVSNTDELTGSAKTAVGEGRSLISRLDRIAQDLEEVADAMRNGDGMLNSLLYDAATAQRLNDALTSLGSFLERVQRQGVNVNVELGHE